MPSPIQFFTRNEGLPQHSSARCQTLFEKRTIRDSAVDVDAVVVVVRHIGVGDRGGLLRLEQQTIMTLSTIEETSSRSPAAAICCCPAILLSLL
jgi:hypothetical protein